MSIQKVALGELAKIKTGKLDANASSPDGAYPFFTCAQKPLRISSYSYDCDCVLVAGNGDLNVKHYSGKFDAYQRTYIVEPSDLDRLDTRYLYYFLDMYLVTLREQSIGGIIKYIKLGNLTGAKIPLPPLHEQRRVAAILDKADSLRQKRRQAIEKLDQLMQSVFLDMFGDPVTNPKGWPEDRTLTDIADIVSGITKGRKTAGKALTEVPYLAVANVQDRKLKLDNVKTIEATDEEISRYALKVNDLLLTEGGDPDKLGRGALWAKEIPNCIHQNHVFRVRLKSSDFNPVFLNYLIGSSRGKRYFLKQAKQTTGIASINMGQLKRFPLLEPPISLQNKFAEVVDKISAQAGLLKRGRENELFSSIQQRAFNGTL